MGTSDNSMIEPTTEEASDDAPTLESINRLLVQQLAEARNTLSYVADRLDEFAYGELAAVLNDGPLDENGDDIIGAARVVLPVAPETEHVAPFRSNPEIPDAAQLAKLAELGGLEGVWRHGCDAGMVAP